MQKIARFLMKSTGWKIVGTLPELKQYVLIAAPHTSNWDVIVGLAARFVVGVKINFLVKHQLFFFPLGNLLKALGAMPVNRSKKSNVVEQIAEIFQTQDEFKLTIAPEGTRSPVTRWKEGFYHIAMKAQVPIVMIGLDYGSKAIRISEPFTPSGDIQADFDHIFAYFKTIKGRSPKEIPDVHLPKS